MTVADTKQRLVKVAQEVYTSHNERAAMRCALGDAAALCDSLAKEVAHTNRGRRGRGPVTKQGEQLALIAKRCADEIWSMREKIETE